MRRKRILNILILSLLILSLVAPVVFYQAPELEASSSSSTVYRIPITITEHSGSNLTDYAVNIELNETNFQYWSHIVSENASDIYFTDEDDDPLYYWIESFNRTNKTASIWVKIPNIPANGQVTIYMYYGGNNPYTTYRDPEQVFVFFDDFESGAIGSEWSQHLGTWGIDTEPDGNHFLIKTGTSNTVPGDQIYINTIQHSGGYAIRAKVKASSSYTSRVAILYNPTNKNMVYLFITENLNQLLMYKHDGTNFISLGSATGVWSDGEKTILELALTKSGKLIGRDIKKNLTITNTITTFTAYPAVSIPKAQSPGYWDNVIVRKFVYPEPTFSIGSEKLIKTVELPSETLYLIHNITYMPNASQFTHTFTAVNSSTAGYILGTPDEYGWAVYVNPYDSTENNATLISEVNITLPYSEVLVVNVTLYAKINGTGNYSQLWVKLLNSTGEVVAELINASLDTNWTELVIPVNTSLSGNITLEINATVESSNTTGEELVVRNVSVSIGYETNPTVEVILQSGFVDYYNCSAEHYVELGSTEYLNSTVIILKLIEYLTYNTTDYPVQPVFVGNETIDSYNYSVYRISPANYTQKMTIYAFIENGLKAINIHVRGYETETVLVGELVTIELPVAGNITIVETNETFTNVTSVNITFDTVGVYTIEGDATEPSKWTIGYVAKTIFVKYGEFSARVLDLDSKEIDYEDFTLQLINKANGSIVKELTGNKAFNLTGLWAGNYTLKIKFKDIVVAVKDFELNASTDGSTVNLTCPMKKLPADYRGLSRTIATNYDKEIVSIENISTKFPYSRTRILLNGTGSFKLYINYMGDLPTKVSVTVNNVTNLKYYWDGNYLVIEGVLGSLGEINITDLYKVRLELYDRLGHPMPEWIYAYINETQYFGSVIEDYLYPEDYVLELPETIYGFEFYSYFDGYNETVRNITINNTDVLYKVWYRIPTKIEPVKAFQVAASWFERFLKPFISSDENTTKVYIEGYLRDYYDNGVPNRPLIVNITDVQANLTWSVNTTTDLSGYFRTPLLDLIRGRTYEIKIIYSGDSIYVGTLTTTEFTPETLPEAPAPITEIIPINYIILGIGALVIVGAIVGIIRAIKHTIEDIRETKRFIRRRR